MEPLPDCGWLVTATKNAGCSRRSPLAAHGVPAIDGLKETRAVVTSHWFASRCNDLRFFALVCNVGQRSSQHRDARSETEISRFARLDAGES
jgi:hypothetical protein